MRSVTVVILIATSLVFTACFQEDAARPEIARTAPKLSLSRAHPTPASRVNSATPALNSSYGSATEYYFSAGQLSLNAQDFDLPEVIAPENAARVILENPREKESVRAGAVAGMRTSRARQLEARREDSGILLNASFRSLFASVFGGHERDSLAEAWNSQSDGDEIQNPFTEARKEIEAEKGQAAERAAQAPHSSSAAQAAAAEEKANPPVQQPRSASDAATGSVSRHEARYMFLGDFDQSGTLRPVLAERVGEAKFAFEDASRTFVILSNSSAVEDQRSVAVEDLDGDGNTDLLLTSRASLFGAVLLGDGQGSFRVSDTFLTGYEPAVAIPGPMREGGREILTVNLRSGSTAAFRRQGHYLRYAQGNLGFTPDYLARLTNMETGLDFLLAGQIGNSPDIYEWPGNTRIAEPFVDLPSEPGITIGSETAAGCGIGLLQVYQIGPFASVVLSNSQGQRFNVANLRVVPQVFLVFGDIEKRGTLDVGVAFLLAADR